MTKKFSTLMAGLLMAGGLFTSVNAENIAGLAETAPGRYFEIVKNADYDGSKWAASNEDLGFWHLVWTAEGVVYSTAKVEDNRDNSIWTVTAVAGKERYFTLTTKSGKKLTVTMGDAVISEFAIANYNEVESVLADGETNCLTFMLNEDTYYLGINETQNSDGTYSVACNKAGKSGAKGFDAEEVQLAKAMSVKEVNSFLGAREGFKLSIGYLKDNDPKKFTAYNPLEGNVFAGVLKAKGKSADTEFELVNEEGQYLVLTTRDWNNQNTKIGNKFVLMTEKELADQRERDGKGGLDAADPVILTTKFQISTNEYAASSDYIEVAAVYTEESERKVVELLVSGYNNKYYLTVDNDKVALEPDFNNIKERTFVKFGGDKLVYMPSFAQKVYYSFINSNGEVAGANCTGNSFRTYFQKEAQADMPEGQWLLSNVTSTEATFSNRESKQTFTVALSSFYTTDEEGVYEIAGRLYTISTVAFDEADKGYEDFGDTRLKNFNVGLYSPVWGGVLNLVENHASADHQIGLDAEAATVWNLLPNAAEAEFNKNTGVKTAATDSVYVINDYKLWNATNKNWNDSHKDTLKIVSYLIQNAENGEYIAYNGNAKKEFYYCGNANRAKAFAFKKVGDSYNMVEVNLGAKATDDAKIKGGKIYGGDSANKGLLSNVDCIYDRTENDLFKVEPANIAWYRRIENGLDTISIYRAENASQLLFETGGFLGWANEHQFDFAPAMLADTAYVEEGAIRPQYMLVVGKPVVTEGTDKPCDICGSMDCEHSTSTYDTVEGRYLVNLKDSAIAFDNKNIHAVNPYTNTEGYYRLGFVEAKRVNKTLTIASTGKKLNIGTPDYNEAKFAFRYVDEAEGTFKIETADFVKAGKTRGEMLKTPGYVKTMNGVIVVVSDANDADIFNMNEDEDRTPTANEGVEADAVKVTATEGAVIVKGAEGKKVVISNVLGQTIANTTVASSEATITAPAGVVVVAVEGEAAVKAIVK